MTLLELHSETLMEGVASPFLPGTNIQYAWDSTSLGYIKTCPRLYQYIMIDGWSGKDESIHLRFGIEFHSAVQDFETARARGDSHDEALRFTVWAALKRTFDWDPDITTRAGKYKNRDSLIRTIVWYFDFYKQDAAKTFILENGRPAVELSFRFELPFGPKSQPTEPPNADWEHQVEPQPYLLSGHLDRVVEFQGALFVMDHKTTLSTPGEYFFDGFNPSNQMTLYSLAGKIVLNAPIKGVFINAIQLKLGKYEGATGESEFRRGPTYRTTDQLDEWTNDLHYWLALSEQFALANYWPMNDTSCDKFGGCKFREICSRSPKVRDIYLKSNFTKLAPEDRWNPLRSR